MLIELLEHKHLCTMQYKIIEILYWKYSIKFCPPNSYFDFKKLFFFILYYYIIIIVPSIN